MSRPWIKLYTEMLREEEVCDLSDSAYRRFVELLLFAGERDLDGDLGSLKHMARNCYVSIDTMRADVSELAELGFLSEHDGVWYITNWKKRQPENTDADRARAYRQRKKKAERDDDKPVTPPSHDAQRDVSHNHHALDKEIDLEKEKEEENPPKSPLGGVWPAIPESLNEPRMIAALAEWEAFRRERKPKLTKLSAKKLVNTLVEWGVERSIAAIDHSIMNTYQGVYEPNKKNGRHPPNKPALTPAQAALAELNAQEARQ